MSIKKTNERIIITLPTTQVKWLESMSKKAEISKSKFVSYFLARKADELYNFMKFNENKPTPQELEELMEIIHTKWIEE